MARLAHDDESSDEIDFRPTKRVRLIADNDSAYASLSSSIVDEGRTAPAAINGGIADVDALSTTSATARRPKSFFCTYEGCDKAFDRPARLEIHIRSHTHERPFICEAEGCEKTFQRSEHLKAHITSKHSDIRRYICDYITGYDENGETVLCGKSFHTGTRLRRHIAAHDDKEQTKCQECGQTFRKQETLQRHIRSEHLGENAFRCSHMDEGSEECGQSFATVGQMKAHVSREHASLRYFCDQCQAEQAVPVGFVSHADLQAHMKLVHPPACSICGETYPSSRALKAHMEIVHAALADRQRFECEHPGCDRKFTKKGNLVVHVRTVHAKEKSYVCGQYDLSKSSKVAGWSGIGCGDSFGAKAALEGHVRTQHLGLPAASKSTSLYADAGPEDAPQQSIVSVSDVTGYGYEEVRPIECLEQSCQDRFQHEHGLVVHLELHHGWNIDDINDALVEASALTGDKFWIGGGDPEDDLLYQQLSTSLGVEALDPAFET